MKKPTEIRKSTHAPPSKTLQASTTLAIKRKAKSFKKQQHIQPKPFENSSARSEVPSTIIDEATSNVYTSSHEFSLAIEDRPHIGKNLPRRDQCDLVDALPANETYRLAEEIPSRIPLKIFDPGPSIGFILTTTTLQSPFPFAKTNGSLNRTGKRGNKSTSAFKSTCGPTSISLPSTKPDEVKHWETYVASVPEDYQRTSTLISQFHTIEKTLARTKDPIERKRLLKQQAELGGLNTYQAASSYAGAKEKGGETGKWCAKALEERLGSRKDITLLDVGAISGTSYEKFKWIHTTSIDLNPQNVEKVLKYDFMKFPIPSAPNEVYDVIGLSLVLNFVGDLKQRSDMIRHAHSYLKPFGFLFIVLPLACVENSRYLDSDRFIKILESLGFVPVKQHNSSKLTFWLTQRSGLDGLGIIQKHVKWPKVEVRSGAMRNNFCIKV